MREVDEHVGGEEAVGVDDDSGDEGIEWVSWGYEGWCLKSTW